MQEIVSQIMTRHVVTISSNRSALDAALLMKKIGLVLSLFRIKIISLWE